MLVHRHQQGQHGAASEILTEFLAYARANPGKISWGSSGIGGPQHLAGMQFAKVAGVEMVHVPYRGNGPMLQALLQNDVQLTFDTPTLVHAAHRETASSPRSP